MSLTKDKSEQENLISKEDLGPFKPTRSSASGQADSLSSKIKEDITTKCLLDRNMQSDIDRKIEPKYKLDPAKFIAVGGSRGPNNQIVSIRDAIYIGKGWTTNLWKKNGLKMWQAQIYRGMDLNKLFWIKIQILTWLIFSKK